MVFDSLKGNVPVAIARNSIRWVAE
jgi:hypothetical protein